MFQGHPPHPRLLALFIVTPLLCACYPRTEKTISGEVYDCTTHLPVAGAAVSTQQTGWGFSNDQLVWDKTYTTSATSDTQGHFTIAFSVGDAAKLHVAKEGYHTAEQFETPGSLVHIGLLPAGSVRDFTHNCRLIADCLACENHDGVQVCRDICLDDGIKR